jgi:phospho-N-acetylmuramoyl-pentapeptide-transferase
MLSLMESGGVGFLFALFVTPIWIRFLRARSMGQLIREDAPSTHLAKAGTPTMGGVIIVCSAVLGYVMGHVGTSIVFTRAGVLAVCVTVASGLLGFSDDYLAIRNARNLGLNKLAKFIGLLAIAAIFALLAVYWVHSSTNLSFTRLSLPGWNLTAVGWILLAVLVIVASSNAVNLTDGLDGLAAGSGTFCFGVLAIIGYWQFRHYSIYRLHAALDLGLVAVALVGACLGFLWWNAAPAKIIMGDTGALAIGTGLGALCLLMNLDLLLIVIGGLFVAETASVILQVVSFRVFGRRIFRIAPFHHHFEMLDWPETTVLIRFWIIAGLCAMLGLGIFYGDFLKIAKVV